MDSGHDIDRAEPAAIDRIPLEILTAILLEVPRNRHRRRMPTEVELSQVSSRWRAAAVSTPAFWTDVYLYSTHSIPSAHEYLRRSGTALLLNVRVDIYDEDKSNGDVTAIHCSEQAIHQRDKLISALQVFLAPVIPRIKALLVFTYWEDTLERLVRSFGPGPAPQLRRFRALCGQRRPSSGTIPDAAPSLFQEGMPHIEYLETPALHAIDAAAVRSLRELQLNEPTLFSRVLRDARLVSVCQTAATSLVSISIEGEFNSTSQWPSDYHSPRFDLPNLRNLRFMDNSDTTLKFLLSATAPRLESLWFEGILVEEVFRRYLNSPQIQANPIKFPTLRYLTWPLSDFDSVEKVAQALPTVTHFHCPYADFRYCGRHRVLDSVFKTRWTSARIFALSLRGEGHLPTFLEVESYEWPVDLQFVLDRELLQTIKRLYPDHLIARKGKPMQDYPEYWWSRLSTYNFNDL